MFGRNLGSRVALQDKLIFLENWGIEMQPVTVDRNCMRLAGSKLTKSLLVHGLHPATEA